MAMDVTTSRRSAKACCLALQLALVAPIASAAGAPSIAQSFAAFWHAAQGRPFAQQELWWDREIEASRRDLYASVVWETRSDPAWRERRQRWLHTRLAQYPGLAAGIPGEIGALRDAIATQSANFRELFPDASTHPPVEILLAPNFDAKSGVLADGSPVLVFAVDSLLLEKANLGIVVPHELFHLYHAQQAGIRNDGVMPGVDLTLPLFEEGLATYVSGQLSPGHTDGELLLQDDLGRLTQAQLPAIAARFLRDAQDRAINPAHPEAFKRWFNAGATPYQRDLPDRTGYWLGLQLVRYLRRSHSLAQIAAWSPVQAQEQALAALRQLGGQRSK